MENWSRNVPAVSVEGISFGYSSSEDVVADLHLVVEAGRALEIVGPNGSGKSTILKLIGGILVPSSGHLSVHGHVPSQLRAAARTSVVRYMPQRIYEFFLYASIGEEIERIACVGRLPAQKELLDLFEIRSPEAANPADLPELEAWRLALCMSATAGPHVLLIDEVPSYSSPACLRAVERVITSRRESGLTTVISCHRSTRLSEAMDSRVEL